MLPMSLSVCYVESSFVLGQYAVQYKNLEGRSEKWLNIHYHAEGMNAHSLQAGVLRLISLTTRE